MCTSTRISTRRIVWALGVAAVAVVASLLLVTALTLAQTAGGTESPGTLEEVTASSVDPLAPTQGVSVTFPSGPWPWFAQEEISVHPEPPRADHPTEICAVVINHDSANVHTATLEFGVANFGIGVPFMHVGAVDVEVPPGGAAQGCVVWVPPARGHWCIEVLLMQERVPEVQRSQRNIDIWEPLVPGEQHDLVFPVGPLPVPGMVTFTLENLLPGWDVALNPAAFFLDNGVVQLVTLTTRPPVDGVLGTREPIVDIEGFLDGETIGGFRKLDTPPVLLHRLKDPSYAESEISISPYPVRAGEPTEVCVELFNMSDQLQIVQVQFSWANFGIGLPFDPIAPPIEVEIPPHSHVPVCIGWIPPFDGRFCIQVEMNVLGDIPYHPQFSQRNIDVGEPLVPGEPHTLAFPVGNPLPDPVTITLELVPHLHGWGLELSQDVLLNMDQTEQRVVSLTVTPPRGVPLPSGETVIVDVEAYVEDELLGGFRKTHRPTVILHRFPDPPYAEREISVHPYPPMAGEPTEICVELYNPTPWLQDVEVQFSWANFGIGLPFTPINGLRSVHLPPHSMVNECIHWIPPMDGHVCLQVELFMEGEEPQRSQRNIDVYEPLVPGVSHTLPFSVSNPLDYPVDVELGLIPHLDRWEFELLPSFLPDMAPGEVQEIVLTVIPPPGVPLPPDGTPIVDVEAYAEGHLIGGFRKIHRPRVPLHPFPDPPYAEREITVHPYPPEVGEPTEICVELRNPTPWPQDVMVQFSWANFGIGLPFMPINGLRPVHLPPHSMVRECIHWIPPVSGHVCLQVELFMEGEEPQRSQRNIDVDEPLRPNEPHSRFFPVGNPFNHPVTITLGFVPHLDGWDVQLMPDVLFDMPAGHVEEVLLTVRPPGELPPDEHPVVDIEAFVDGELVGGFRKIFRPEVPVHVPGDPVYAEREILVHPYPPRAFEPTELAVEIRNPTDEWQSVEVLFSVAPFGIGLPFDPVHEPMLVEVPPDGMVVPSTMWVPPHRGLWCIQVEIFIPGHDAPFWSRLNLDVGEPLEPNTPHSRPFRVGSWPYTEPVTITLGLIPHFHDWGLELSEDVLYNVQPGEAREVILTVTPPDDLPADGDPIVDVEAFVEGELLGGFRKIFRPPVPIHRPRDPIYAESEIGVDPYPVLPGQPVELSVEVFNPTDEDHIATATFSVAPFGIGLPFSTTRIVPNPVLIFVPAHGAARGHVVWEPPPGMRGKFCVQVELELPGHEKIWSQRNVDVGEPLEPGQPHSLTFLVGSSPPPVEDWPFTDPVTITLGLVKHREMWDVRLSKDTLVNVTPSQPVSVTLTVTPLLDTPLGTGEPIVDVEAFVEGELLGGFRKLDISPIPIHKPHEKSYAETELHIIPDPPRLGQPAQIGAVMQNNGPTTSTILLEFGYARFGVGVPFTTTNMVPPTRTLTVGPMMTDTAWVTWTPTFSGCHCVMVKLIDPDGDYEDIVSQRNVQVVDRPPCGTTRVFTLTLSNDGDMSVTVDLGLITFNVPEEWEVTTVPSGTVKLEPHTELVVEVRVRIPCPGMLQLMRGVQNMDALQTQAGGVPTIDVEGYVDGKLIGGIELQFETVERFVYLPMVLRNWP